MDDFEENLWPTVYEPELDSPPEDYPDADAETVRLALIEFYQEMPSWYKP